MKQSNANNAPLVSVYMPTHNRADLLPRAIESVLNQTYKNIELIIVDDGSTDGTQDVLKKYANADSRLRFFTHDEPKGACAARNFAIRNAKGFYITGIDDDDEFTNERIRSLLDNYDVSFSFVYADDLRIEEKRKKLISKKAEVEFDDLLYFNCVGNQIFTERSKVIEVGLFDEGLLAAQDYDLWLRMTKFWGKAKGVGKALQTVYADNSDSITFSKKRFSGYFRFYKKHKDCMSKKQRISQLVLVRRAQTKKYGRQFIFLLLKNYNFKSAVRCCLYNCGLIY